MSQKLPPQRDRRSELEDWEVPPREAETAIAEARRLTQELPTIQDRLRVLAPRAEQLAADLAEAEECAEAIDFGFRQWGRPGMPRIWRREDEARAAVIEARADVDTKRHQLAVAGLELLEEQLRAADCRRQIAAAIKSASEGIEKHRLGVFSEELMETSKGQRLCAATGADLSSPVAEVALRESRKLNQRPDMPPQLEEISIPARIEEEGVVCEWNLVQRNFALKGAQSAARQQPARMVA